MPFIGFVLIAMGLFAVGGTLYMVIREPHEEQEEWYVPPGPGEAPLASQHEPNAMSAAEVVGTQMTNASPIIDDEAGRRAD